MKKKVLLFLSLVGIAVMIHGCGQGQPQLTASSSQPSGVILRGTVYAYTNNDQGTFGGWLWSGSPLVYSVGAPAPSVFLTLSGARGTWHTTSNEKGEYLFSNVPDGEYVIVATAEGYQRYKSSSIFIKPCENTPADNTIVTEDMVLSSWPIVIKVSPEADSVVSDNQTFIFTFNEPVDPDSTLAVVAPAGIRAMTAFPNKYADSNCTFDFSTDHKVLTIIPKGKLVSNLRYYVVVYTEDLQGFPLRLATNVFGERMEKGDEAIYPFISYRVAAGGLPPAPSNLQVAINNKPTPEVDYADVITPTFKVKLNWSPSSSGNITGYKVYAAKSGSVLNYVPLEADSSTSTSTTKSYFTSDISKVINALYGTGAQVDPISTQNYPFVNDTIYFKVVAFNGDGESSGVGVSARDAKGPTLSATAKKSTNWNTGAVLENNYYLPAITDTKVAYIAFKEPVDLTTAGNNDNYTIAGGNVLSATVMTRSSSALTTFAADAYTIVKIEADVTVSGNAITAKEGTVNDLSGNVVATGGTSVTP